jgi:anti-anti-sigma factor
MRPEARTTSEGTKIIVGGNATGLFAEIKGRATHMEAHVFRKYALERIDGGCRHIEIDLASCPSMDSTFLGVLASIGMQLQSLGGEVTLFHLCPQCNEALRTLGVNRFVHLEEREEAGAHAAPASLAALPGGDTSGDWGTTMLEAHELLANIDAGGSEKWAGLVAMLRADIERKKDGHR